MENEVISISKWVKKIGRWDTLVQFFFAKVSKRQKILFCYEFGHPNLTGNDCCIHVLCSFLRLN